MTHPDDEKHAREAVEAVWHDWRERPLPTPPIQAAALDAARRAREAASKDDLLDWWAGRHDMSVGCPGGQWNVYIIGEPAPFATGPTPRAALQAARDKLEKPDVDPDVLLARKVCGAEARKNGWEEVAQEYEAGSNDSTFQLLTVVAAIKAAKEREG